MAEIGRWNGHIFEIDAGRMFSFSDLNITASCATEDKESGKQKYASREAANATDISLTILLHRELGADVRNEAMGFMEDARAGLKDYFYIGNAKLVPYSLMLTEANASEIDIGPEGKWEHANLRLKFKQAEKDGSTASSGSSSGSSSGKKGSDKSDGGNGNKANSYTSPQYASIVATVKQAKAATQQTNAYQKEKMQYEAKKGAGSLKGNMMSTR